MRKWSERVSVPCVCEGSGVLNSRGAGGEGAVFIATFENE